MWIDRVAVDGLLRDVIKHLELFEQRKVVTDAPGHGISPILLINTVIMIGGQARFGSEQCLRRPK